MKKISAILIATFLLSSVAQAGWKWDKARYRDAKNPHYTSETTTAPSYCFDGGFDLSLYGSGIWPENIGNNGIGGGLGISYFFNRNLGLEVAYAAHGSGVSQQVGMLNFIYRMPIESKKGWSFAPYVHGGPGILSAGASEFTWDIGGGLDFRFESWGCTGLFADYTFAFADDNIQDYSLVRVGVKFPF